MSSVSFYYLHQGDYVFTHIGLSVWRISQKLADRFLSNMVGDRALREERLILYWSWSCIEIQEFFNIVR